MSKLLNLYTNFKKQNSNTMYLFKIGLFYNFLNDDAQKISNLLHLKITNLNRKIEEKILSKYQRKGVFERGKYYE